MKRNVGAAVTFVLGALLLSAAVVTYWGENMVYTYELTFLSNTIAGAVLLAAASLRLKGKDLPQLSFLCLACLLLTVFLVSVVFRFGFSGGLFFLHLVDPLAMLVFFLVLCDMRSVPIRAVPAVLVMPLFYLIFALVFGRVTGNYIYPFLNYEANGTAYTAVFVLATALGLLAAGYGLYFSNRLLKKVFCAMGKRRQDHGASH